VQQGGECVAIQRESTESCTKPETDYIGDAVTKAYADIGKVLPLMTPRPLTDDVKNALWLAFRDDSDSTADKVSKNLQTLRNNITGTHFTCQHSQDDAYAKECAGGIYGHVKGQAGKHVDPVFLCMPQFSNLNTIGQARAVIHETAHRFLNVEDTGYFTMPDCLETPRPAKSTAQDKDSGTAGDAPVYRLNNADAYACFVHFMVYTTAADRTSRAQAYRGANLTIDKKTRGVEGEVIYAETKTPADPTFSAGGVPANSGFRIRWRFEAGGASFDLTPAGHYSGSTNTFDEENKSVSVSSEVRTALAGKNLTEGKITCEVQLFGSAKDQPAPPTVTKELSVKIRGGRDPAGEALP
jgi:hypothetical protein